ncbi:hypothetical protein KKA14_19540, partial [bacterium]|nr:hypothetical protein [bacterium]
ALLIDAVGTGRRAARSINLFLNGQDLSFPEGTYKKPTRIKESGEVPLSGVSLIPRVEQPELPVDSRINTYDEVDLVLTPELMEVEANRCMRCGTLCYFSDSQKEKIRKGKTIREKMEDFLTISPE